MITMKKTSALVLGIAMLLSSMPSKAADANQAEFPLQAKLIIAGIGTVVAGWAALYSRKSEKEFRSRFSTEKIRNIRKVGIKEFVKNFGYFISDEIIGQRKQSSTLKAKADGKIYPSEDTPAYGLLGNIDAYAAPLAESAKKFTEPLFQAGMLWTFVKGFAVNPSWEAATKAPSK